MTLMKWVLDILVGNFIKWTFGDLYDVLSYGWESTDPQSGHAFQFPLFVWGTTLYICMSALPFG